MLRNPAELLFGAFLIYYFRLLERHTGSKKFGAFALATTGISYCLQLAVSKVAGLTKPLPSGPYPFIFACFVQFFFQVPALSKFTVLGWRLSDKVGRPGIQQANSRSSSCNVCCCSVACVGVVDPCFCVRRRHAACMQHACMDMLCIRVCAAAGRSAITCIWWR